MSTLAIAAVLRCWRVQASREPSLEIEIAVIIGGLGWFVFENGHVKVALHPDAKIQEPNYAEKIIFGKIPVDNIQHIRILVPPVQAAIGLAQVAIPFDSPLEVNQAI